jgi:hypothetical protein
LSNFNPRIQQSQLEGNQKRRKYTELGADLSVDTGTMIDLYNWQKKVGAGVVVRESYNSTSSSSSSRSNSSSSSSSSGGTYHTPTGYSRDLQPADVANDNRANEGQWTLKSGGRGLKDKKQTKGERKNKQMLSKYNVSSVWDLPSGKHKRRQEKKEIARIGLVSRYKEHITRSTRSTGDCVDLTGVDIPVHALHLPVDNMPDQSRQDQTKADKSRQGQTRADKSSASRGREVAEGISPVAHTGKRKKMSTKSNTTAFQCARCHKKEGSEEPIRVEGHQNNMQWLPRLPSLKRVNRSDLHLTIVHDWIMKCKHPACI